MRLWTLHPRYLDAKGLVAAWREALLAQKVLAGKTRGYTNHPQLHRFRAVRPATAQPRAIGAYLAALADEAETRGYHFDKTKIAHPNWCGKITETRGQLLYEWAHLLAKLKTRAPKLYAQWKREKITEPKPHPIFRIVDGNVQEWEKR